MNNFYKDIKRIKNLQGQNRFVLKKKISFKFVEENVKKINNLKNQKINLYRLHNNINKISYNKKLLNRIYLKIENYKTIRKLINKVDTDVFKYNNKNKYLIINNYKDICKNKNIQIGLNSIYRKMYLNKSHNLWMNKYYINIFNNKYNNKILFNLYVDIFKNKYNKKFVFDFYTDIFKYNNRTKYLRHGYKDIMKYHKIRFLKKQVKYTKFSSDLKYKFFKKDCKTFILKVNTKERFLNIYKRNIYKNILKTRYIKAWNKNINKYILRQCYVNKYLLDIKRYKYYSKYLYKDTLNIYKILLKNKYLIKEEIPIYLLRQKHRFLEKSWINIYRIKTVSKYLDIQRKWWILGHDDLVDKLIIPNIDYPYETQPIIGIDKHPISSYKNIDYTDVNYGNEEIEVSIKIMQQMLNYLFVIWNCALIDWYKLEAKDAMPKIMDVFYYWLNLDNVKEEMEQKGSRKDYLRVYRWFRWEAEKIWFKTKDNSHSIKNNGIKSVGMLTGNIIEYMKNHHYDITPITSSYHLTIMGNMLITFTWQLPDYFRPIDKNKGKRKYYISNKSINQIRKKLIYKK